ncbi:glutamate-gated chloride channel alpha-like isoform X2 [Panonychus citri]|uniref:glutamate-gated chloride channel alpha-like isoform X2 n=1 Tax=Panonychus citri TaxID=50023 RepID=UPI002306FE5D|nr:glutamate-gated chloride channel alpha-like isoform X2 [Panonychus citri]
MLLDLKIKSSCLTINLIQLLVIKSVWTSINLPLDDKGPLNITMNMIIEDINSINPLTMDFRLEFFLTHKWITIKKHCQSVRQSIESRETIESNGKPIILKGNDLTTIWVPDTFIYNAKQVGPTTFDDGYKSLIVSFSGPDKCSFTYTLRLSALIPCPMNFRWYPVDKQICRVSIRSADQISYSWFPKGVIIETKVPLLQHSLGINYYKLIATVHDQALFTWLIVDLTFTRIISYHVIQIYLPTIILVTISYCSLWMGNDYIAGRITLGVTTQLALITQFSGLKSRLPQVSYIIALDVWMIVCMIFIFSTILITTIIIVINQHQSSLLFKQIVNNQRTENQSRIKQSNRLENNWLNKISSYALNHQSCVTNQSKNNIETIKSEMMINPKDIEKSLQLTNHLEYLSDNNQIGVKIDQILRFIYPIIFLLFNCLYWLTLFI